MEWTVAITRRPVKEILLHSWVHGCFRILEFSSFRKVIKWNQAQWPMPVIPTTWEAEVRGSGLEANLGKVRPYLKKQARCGGAPLQSQLYRMYRLEDCRLGQPGQKVSETLSQ
jgi:hypothetical protein